ncbi:MAG: imidazoleglycerol-phosphate dehydratase HisB [Deltaproteobacteria bacterium]|nr:imidazoleglycerol-phosphate dehydratase HisB [Deltaproteobacteria bacterium]
MTRQSAIKRQTSETDISLQLSIDGTGQADIQTGVPFMDHMLTLFTVHGFFDLTITAHGDTAVDGHHTVEDLGICLGQALKEALAGGHGIKRYGNSAVPMDESLVRISLDISNRPFLQYQVIINEAKTGSFDTSLTKEFLRAFTLHAGITMHVDMIRGENAHHIIEAIFKALGQALDQATNTDERIKGVMSSKGSL